MGGQLSSCVEGVPLFLHWKWLFLNRSNVYVALLYMRNVGSSGVVAGRLSIVMAAGSSLS